MTKVFGALTLASALFFVGCSDITQGSMSGDTILSLEAPKVTAIAYPGQIQATWTKVPDANGYDVQVLADGQELATTAYSVSNEKITIGTSVNAIEYTIRVSARSDAAANPARAVSVLDSKYGEAKVKAIVPPAGTSALQLAAYESGYDGKVKTAKDVLTADKIRVTQDKNDLYVSIQAKCYLNYDIDLVDEYGVLTNTISTTANSITKNDQWIEMKISNTTYGKKTLAVKVTAVNNSSLYPEDKVTGETYTYTEFSYGVVATGTSVSATYVDNIRAEGEGAKNAVRLTWTPATYEGKPVPVDMYKVYRRSAYSNELVEVTKAEEKDEEGNVTSPAVVVKVSDLTSETNNTVTMYDSVKYYIDTEVEDATIMYAYYVVVAKDDSIANEVVTLAPKAADYAAASTVSGIVTNTKVVNDVVANDIEWTITKANKYQTVKAYVLMKPWDNENKKGYKGGKPLAEDFDTAEENDLVATAVVTSLDDKVVTIVQEDVEPGKYWMLVVTSEDGKKPVNTISANVKVGVADEPTIAADSLLVKAYDANKNDLTAVSNYVENKNDVVVTFTDTIDTTVESIETYKYELFKAKKNIVETEDKTAIYTTIGAFEAVEGFTMVADVIPNVDKTDPSYTKDAVTYVGIIKENDLAAGTYVYKVVKTNETIEKYASQTAEVTISEVDALSNAITFTASVAENVVLNKDGKTWEPATENAATATNRFTVTLSSYILYKDTNTNQVSTSYEDLSAGVTLTLYRAETVDGQKSAVYTKVATAFAEDTEAQVKADISVNVYKEDGTLDAPKVTKDVVIGKTFNLNDTVSTTADVAYSYILVASKEGYEDVTVTIN